MGTSAAQPFPRHYIIVVHGIGEQRHNETTVEVVHRFAEARSHTGGPVTLAGLMPADLSSQSIRRSGGGHGWSEFRGIPVDPQGDTGRFDGTRAARTAGRNFRFVDLRWADILQEHAATFSSPPEQWATARVRRLEEPFTSAGWMPNWAMPLLREVDASVVPAKALMKRVSPELENLVFNRVIGDIHLYGDYARTRGQAVRRFHWVLDEIFLRDYVQWCRFERKTADEPYVPPVFTILAHSLGTVLSFDALVYAFATDTIRNCSGRHTASSIPFPGYNERSSSEELDEEASWQSLLHDLRDEPCSPGMPDGAHDWNTLTARFPDLSIDPPDNPPLLWRNHVKQFISLGSPIDKYHVLWHHNYRHMGLPHRTSVDPEWAEGWLDETALAKLDQKILHYNLCDEQDPVGHHLDVASATTNYRKVFRYEREQVVFRDVVFRRYAVPGAAHVQYWKDRDLFTGLLGEVIDGRLQGQFVNDPFIQKPGVYRTALIWAYFRIPLIAAVITGSLLSYGWISLATKEFAMTYVVAIAAALLLWAVPNLRQGYQQEMIPTGQHKGQPVKTGFWERWRPRPSLLANLVRGMVAWRRILIWLNEKRDYRVEQGWKTLCFSARVVQRDRSTYDMASAREAGQRLTLKTDGGFWRTVWWRVGGGLFTFALSAGVTCTGHHLLGGAEPSAESGWSLGELLVVGGWSGMTISGCYLATMAYMTYWFYHMKYRAPLNHTGTAAPHPASPRS